MKVKPDSAKTKQKKSRITEHMAPIAFSLAIIYWVLDSIMSYLTPYDTIFENLLGTELDDIWTRLIVMALFAIFGSHAQYIINERKKAEKKLQKNAITRARFQRLLSPNLAEMVVSGDLLVEKGGEERVATVLFVDIRGFTALSENTKASEILALLNEYYEVLVEIVFKLEGTVDKFMGDGMMVIWGAPVKYNDHAGRAVKAAIEFNDAIFLFNEKGKDIGRPEIRIGIGISTGKLTAGYIGSSKTMSYSVIGDTVNIASRLCSIAEPGQILVSENTRYDVGDTLLFEEIESVHLKGRSKSISVFSVKNGQ